MDRWNMECALSDEDNAELDQMFGQYHRFGGVLAAG
jgi:hypothetical protein